MSKKDLEKEASRLLKERNRKKGREGGKKEDRYHGVGEL